MDKHAGVCMAMDAYNASGAALLRKIKDAGYVDQGTGSTFEALENRGFIICKYTTARRDSRQHTLEPFLMVQITTQGRRLVRTATGAKAYQSGSPGVLKEWHWKAMAEAWKARPQGIKDENGFYGHIGWNTWLYLRDYRAQGEVKPLIEECSTWGKYLAHVGYTPQIHWLRLTPFGEEFYRDNWQRYRELYPEVDAPEPDSIE